jgi:cardiolipin synthase
MCPSMAGQGRVVTIPNLVSVGRLAALPLFCWVLFGRDDRSTAAYLLGVLGLTDWVDGYIARRYHQVSTLGKVLDPVADRLLLGVGILALVIDGSVPTWVAWGALSREVVISIAVCVLAVLRAPRIDVTWVGKAGTFALMVAFPLFLGSNAPDLGWEQIAGVLAWCFALPGLVLSWYAALTYLPQARVALAASKIGWQQHPEA